MSVFVSGMLARDAAALFEGVPHNGLSTRSFRLNALTSNQRGLALLLQRALDDALVNDEYIVRQLKDPAARAMMAELVKCAHDERTMLVSVDQSGTSTRWRGELGLCEPSAPPDEPSTPVWDANGPNLACQHIVTACVMSRVNGLKKSIPLSLRSEHTDLSQVHDRVITDRRFRESQGTDPAIGLPVLSLMGPACQGHQPCSWAPAYVGTCTPGDPQLITLAISDPATCRSASMRVCEGVHGCYPSGPPYDEPVGFPTLPNPIYSAFEKEQTGVCAATTPLTFTCPTATATRGYYSVMVRPAAAGAMVDGWPDGGLHRNVVKIAGSGHYPAPEPEVFGFLEGAFYGNMFKPETLGRTCEVPVAGTTLECVPGPMGHRGDTCSISLMSSAPPTGANTSSDAQRDQCLGQDPTIPYKHVYACYSFAQQNENDDDDAASTAELNARLCDVPDTQCFPHPPRRCYRNGRAGAACMAPIGHDGAYGDCRGQGNDTTTYQHIITTYLNDVCDLTESRELCNALRRSMATPAQPGFPGVVQRPHGCGCSAEARAGDVLSILLAALIAIGALRLPRWRRADARA